MNASTITALPLWQPWAQLVAIGAKRIETRHWRCWDRLIGARVAIHATKTPSHLYVCDEEPFCLHIPEKRLLPLGALIGTVVIDRCTRMTAELIDGLAERNPLEHAFGLYEEGRWAWVLRDAELFSEPVPWKGSQGPFEVPLEALGLVPAQERLAL